MKSISSRLTLWYALAVTISAAVFMICGRFLIEKSYIEGIDQLNDKEFEEIQNRIEDPLAKGDIEAALHAIRDHAKLDAALFFFQVGQSDGSRLFTSDNFGEHFFPDSIHNETRATVFHSEFGRLRIAEYTVRGLDIHIASSLSGLDGLFANLYRVGLGGLLLVFMLSLVIGRFLSKVALQPIAQMQKAASRITAENLSERIEVLDTGDEMSLLGNLLNTMFDRLERSFDEIQKFTADASHELKTPLSLIRLSSEKIRANLGDSNREYAQLLDNQLEMIDRLNKVVNDLLVLAKADAGSLSLSCKRIEVTELVQDFAQDAEALCENAGLGFELHNDCKAFLWGDPVWLHHVLFNLISNAIRFSPTGGSIALISEKQDDCWCLSLQDDGPGIPEEKLELVFRRFYNEPDQSGGKGSGLGLPLCRGIVRLHHGELVLLNRGERSGIVARMTLPFADEE